MITTLDVGGAEMHLLSQVRGQCARGHQVRVVYLKGEGTLAPDFESAGASEIEQVAPSRPFALAGHIRWADLVHSHLLKADVLTAFVATLAGRRRRLLSGKHNDERALLKPAVSHIHGVVGRGPVCTVVLSDHVGRYIAEHGRIPLSKQRRIYYGIDPAPFEAAAAMAPEERARLRAELGLKPEDVAFVCVARFAAQKAHDVLLRAMRIVRDAGQVHVKLMLVGDDPFGDGRQRAEALAEELELGDAVNFLGIRRDVPKILGATEVFCMASLWEGLGLVFLEAMAAGQPVLATDVSAVPEVVVPGTTGLLVPPSDPEAFAAGILKLAGDADLRARYGEAGRIRVRESFGLDRMVEETLALYEAVLQAAQAGQIFDPSRSLP